MMPSDKKIAQYHSRKCSNTMGSLPCCAAVLPIVMNQGFHEMVEIIYTLFIPFE